MIKYKVREPFFSTELGFLGMGTQIEPYQLNKLTWNEKKKLDKIEFSLDFSVFNYGMIFLSTELPLPEDMHPEESYHDMMCRMMNEVKPCCPDNKTKF